MSILAAILSLPVLVPKIGNARITSATTLAILIGWLINNYSPKRTSPNLTLIPTLFPFLQSFQTHASLSSPPSLGIFIPSHLQPLLSNKQQETSLPRTANSKCPFSIACAFS
ncbi:MAG: hypothetical protein N2035_09410 [Chthoniobacterales bacterium]|nr:hypothetical protein [Chthoniobacterales bacterium]